MNSITTFTRLVIIAVVLAFVAWAARSAYATFTVPKGYVCHKEGGSYETLHIALPAVVAHLQQHDDDYAGACQEEPTPTTAEDQDPTPTPPGEPDLTITPTATPEATPTTTTHSSNGGTGHGDGRSDGRSDGLCSKPPCVTPGQTLLPLPQTRSGK